MAILSPSSINNKSSIFALTQSQKHIIDGLKPVYNSTQSQHRWSNSVLFFERPELHSRLFGAFNNYLLQLISLLFFMAALYAPSKISMATTIIDAVTQWSDATEVLIIFREDPAAGLLELESRSARTSCKWLDSLRYRLCAAHLGLMLMMWRLKNRKQNISFPCGLKYVYNRIHLTVKWKSI